MLFCAQMIGYVVNSVRVRVCAEVVAANVSVTTLSTLISGSFTLSINSYTTVSLPYNVSELSMANAIVALGTGPVTVSRTGVRLHPADWLCVHGWGV